MVANDNAENCLLIKYKRITDQTFTRPLHSDCSANHLVNFEIHKIVKLCHYSFNSVYSIINLCKSRKSEYKLSYM